MAGHTRKAAASPLYRNPFRSASVTGGRIDQGVDYSGRPGDPIYALGPGTILQTLNSGWPGGGFIAERLDAGPLAGQIVYVAENVQPVVSVGQKVDSSTVIGHFTPGPYGIETGFGAPPPNVGQTLAYVTGQADFQGGDIGGWSTQAGAQYSDLLRSLGAPGGQLQAGGVHGPSGTVTGAGAGGSPAAAGCVPALMLIPFLLIREAPWRAVRAGGTTPIRGSSPSTQPSPEPAGSAPSRAPRKHWPRTAKPAHRPMAAAEHPGPPHPDSSSAGSAASAPE
jgi:hypothetical protein